MRTAQRIGLGLVGAATTMVVRRVTRHSLHTDAGEPQLPRAVRRSNSVGMTLVLAAVAGALLAAGDLLREHRKAVTQHA